MFALTISLLHSHTKSSVAAMTMKFTFPGKQSCRPWASCRLGHRLGPFRHPACCVVQRREAGCSTWQGEASPHEGWKLATLEFLRYPGFL